MTLRVPPPLLPPLPVTPAKATETVDVVAPPPVLVQPAAPESPVQGPLAPPPSPETQRSSRLRHEHNPAAAMMQHRMGHFSETESPKPAQTTESSATLGTSAASAEEGNRARVQDFVHKVLTQESEQGPWTADDGMCLDLSGKWLQRFHEAGIPAKLATVDPNRRRVGTPVEKGMEGKFHAYLVAERPGQEALIIDPTWRQFISDPKRGTDGQPEVFIGTQQELQAALQKYEKRLQIEVVDDPLVGNRKTQDVVELGYGLGAHAALRELHAMSDD